MSDSKKSLEENRVPQEATFGDSYFESYWENPDRMQMYRNESKYIETLIASGRILDVGCGLGLFLSQFDSSKWDKYGVDVSELAIAESRKKGIKVKNVADAYDYPNNFFDVIIFRGSLQHLPEPFTTIKKCIELLKSGGFLIFLATPNSNSPYFNRFKTLPILSPELNILIPSDIMMRNVLLKFGMEIVDIRYPYLGSPYARPIRDHFYYLLSFIGIKKKFPFWKSMMEIYARKP